MATPLFPTFDETELDRSRRRLMDPQSYGSDIAKEAIKKFKPPVMLDPSRVHQKEDRGSPEQRAFDATQKVMQSRGLARLEAMQSDDYKIGSGSSLRQTPRELGSTRGRMRRAARALRRQGATGEANKMFAMAELAGMDEPNIVTEEERKRREAEKIQEASLLASNQEKSGQARDMANRLANKRRGGLARPTGGAIQQYQGSVGL